MIKFVNFARKGFGHNPQQDKFVREALENKKNYSNTQKENDARCLQILIENGEKFCDNDVTFKKMHENGVKIRL